MYIAGKTMF